MPCPVGLPESPVSRVADKPGRGPAVADAFVFSGGWLRGTHRSYQLGGLLHWTQHVLRVAAQGWRPTSDRSGRGRPPIATGDVAGDVWEAVRRRRPMLLLVIVFVAFMIGVPWGDRAMSNKSSLG